MVFSSLPFLFFIFPLFILSLFFCSYFKNTVLRNSIIVVFSLFFYLWEESTAIAILIAICLINYYGSHLLIRKNYSKKIFVSLIILNLAVLFAFKYSIWCFSFFTDRFIGKNIMLLGISFFIFHAISYISDVYTKKISPAKNMLTFSTYFYMFPHLVAGPIVRYAQIKDDITSYNTNKDLFSFGMYRFLLGLNKKILIANSVSVLADYTFSETINPTAFTAPEAWAGIIAYALQIYFDFSAYSDMAIGLAAMAGFRFEENFNRPYISTSIREFWKRWHISLSTWLRDYLYIPLGGNRKGTLLTYRNLFIVFLLCGIWHGANTTFIVWGLWHGTFLCLERLFLDKALNFLPRFLRHLYLLIVILIGWVFFKAETLSFAFDYIKALFTLRSFSYDIETADITCFFMLIGTLICFLPQKFIIVPTVHNINDFKTSHLLFQFILALFSVLFLLSSNRNPFIYFNF